MCYIIRSPRQQQMVPGPGWGGVPLSLSLMEVRSDLPLISSDRRLTEETIRRYGPAARPIRMLPRPTG